MAQSQERAWTALSCTGQSWQEQTEAPPHHIYRHATQRVHLMHLFPAIPYLKQCLPLRVFTFPVEQWLHLLCWAQPVFPQHCLQTGFSRCSDRDVTAPTLLQLLGHLLTDVPVLWAPAGWQSLVPTATSQQQFSAQSFFSEVWLFCRFHVTPRDLQDTEITSVITDQETKSHTMAVCVCALFCFLCHSVPSAFVEMAKDFSF